MKRPNEPPELLFEYQTDLKPRESWQALSSEIDEVWSVVRPDAEKGHFTSATMLAHEVPDGIFAKKAPVYPSMFHKGADGIWHRAVMK